MNDESLSVSSSNKLLPFSEKNRVATLHQSTSPLVALVFLVPKAKSCNILLRGNPLSGINYERNMRRGWNNYAS